MSKSTEIVSAEFIQNRIFTIRENQVMIDHDLAKMYQVQTKVLNQAVKRNEERFPGAFRFQLTDLEKDELVTNCDRFENLKHSRVNPNAFTEQGVAMLSAVLRSNVAIKVSIQIMAAFVKMRKFLTTNAAIFQRLENIEMKQLKADQNFEQVFKALESNDTIPKQGIFFDGQVFDAYAFISDLVRTANKSIVLVDNYIDDTVITLISKKKENVKCTLLTKTISKQLKLDAEKFNKQYPVLEIKTFDKAHDRFLIIDESNVYHIGASLKDLGKKWFAFTQLEKESVVILELIKELI